MKSKVALLLFVVVALGSFRSAEAALLGLEIDQSQSSLSITGSTASGIPFTLPQFAGSDITIPAGSVLFDPNGGVITFDGSLSFNLFDQPSPIAPGLNGGSPSPGAPLPTAPGSAPGQYGMIFVFPSDIDDPLNLSTAGIAGYAAIRSLNLSISGSTPFSGSTFNAAALSLKTAGGVLDYNLNLSDGITNSLGQQDLDGLVGANSGAGTGSYALNTLTIPINATFSFDLFGTEPVTLTMTGQIVAHPDPEPATLTIAMIGLAIGGFYARRRHARDRRLVAREC